MKNFVQQKAPLRKRKKQAIDGKKTFITAIHNKGLLSRIKNSYKLRKK